MRFLKRSSDSRETKPRVSEIFKAKQSSQIIIVVDDVLLLYIHGKQLWSCRAGQLTYPHYFGDIFAFNVEIE